MNAATSPSVTTHLRAIVAVFVGGGIGTCLRAFLLSHVSLHAVQAACLSGHCAAGPWANYVPWTLLVINAIGVYGATRLLAGPLRDRGFFDQWRLLSITGFFGGLTSYSSLYTALDDMRHVYPLGAVFAGLTAVLSGAAVAWIAIRSVR